MAPLSVDGSKSVFHMNFGKQMSSRVALISWILLFRLSQILTKKFLSKSSFYLNFQICSLNCHINQRTSTSTNLTLLPISWDLISWHLIFCSPTWRKWRNSPRKCTQVKYITRGKKPRFQLSHRHNLIALSYAAHDTGPTTICKTFYDTA